MGLHRQIGAPLCHKSSPFCPISCGCPGPGVRAEERERDGFPVTAVTIGSPEGAQALGKPEGVYVTKK